MGHGQKLQGTLTAKDVYSSLTSRGKYLHSFPLMKTIYEIAFEGRPVSDIIDGIRVSKSVEDSISLSPRNVPGECVVVETTGTSYPSSLLSSFYQNLLFYCNALSYYILIYN